MFIVTVRAGVVARLLLRVAAAVLRVADLAHEAVLGRPRVDERAEDSRERFVPRMAARGRRQRTISSRPLRERRVTHGTVDAHHYILQPSIVVEPALAMSGPRWPMSHKYSKPPGRWQREIALGRGTFTDL